MTLFGYWVRDKTWTCKLTVGPLFPPCLTLTLSCPPRCHQLAGMGSIAQAARPERRLDVSLWFSSPAEFTQRWASSLHPPRLSSSSSFVRCRSSVLQILYRFTATLASLAIYIVYFFIYVMKPYAWFVCVIIVKRREWTLSWVWSEVWSQWAVLLWSQQAVGG